MPVHEVFVLLFRLSRRDEEMAHFFLLCFCIAKSLGNASISEAFRLSCYAAFGVWADFELSFW